MDNIYIQYIRNLGTEYGGIRDYYVNQTTVFSWGVSAFVSTFSSSTSFFRTELSSSDGWGKLLGGAVKVLTAVQLLGEFGCSANWRNRANCASDSLTCTEWHIGCDGVDEW